MLDALARARRFRSRAMKLETTAEEADEESAKHFRLIAKHYPALARLEEERTTLQPAESELEHEHQSST